MVRIKVMLMLIGKLILIWKIMNVIKIVDNVWHRLQVGVHLEIKDNVIINVNVKVEVKVKINKLNQVINNLKLFNIKIYNQNKHK